MSTLRDRIVDELDRAGVALDDDQLASRLRVRRQQVNQLARDLESSGVLVRTAASGSGKLVNTLRRGGALPRSAAPPTTRPPRPLGAAADLVVHALNRLALRRPVFHAEADFQHALAWELHGGAERVRLEMRPLPDQAVFLDLMVHGPLGRLAIELKYLTGAVRAEVDGEVFSLRDQSAYDVRRYDVVKDLQRLEALLAAGVADHAVAVVLTNVPAYWKPAPGSGTFDASFRIHEGAVLSGKLGWAPGTGDGTMKNRAEPLTLCGSYSMSWRDYSTVGAGPGATFRSLVVPVGT